MSIQSNCPAKIWAKRFVFTGIREPPTALQRCRQILRICVTPDLSQSLRPARGFWRPHRAAFGAAMDKLLAKLDFIVSPATPIPAFEVGPEIPGDVILDQGVNAGSFAFPINLSQQPAVSTPCGLTAAGLPIGLQFVGARGADAKVLSAARDFERASQ
jgi:Asp-tRNA(Asn)/Glu-tRNA(Gln) amidotransferase A subunit family amidase